MTPDYLLWGSWGMDKLGGFLVVWFRKSLMFRKLEVREITSPQALGDGFTSYVTGLSVFFAVLAIIAFIRTNSRLDVGQFAELSVFGFVHVVNAAALSLMLFGFLWILRVGPRLENVVALCCCALGGMLPFVSVGMGLFLDRAVQLAVERGDPSLPYLKAALYQILFADEEVLFIKVIAWLGASISVIAIMSYMYWMIVLLSRVSKRGNTGLVAVATVCAWSLDSLLVRRTFGVVFWRVIIQQAAGHHG